MFHMIHPFRAISLVALLTAITVGCGKTALVPPEPDGTLTVQTLGRLDVAPRIAQSVALSGPLALVGCGDDGVVIVDVSRPDAPIELATIDDVFADTVAAEAERVFVMTRSRLTRGAERAELDLLDPRTPLVLSRDELEDGGAVGIAVEGPNLAFVTGAGGAERVGRLGATTLDLNGEHGLACAIRRGQLYIVSAPETWGGFGPATLRRYDADSATPNGSLPLVEPIADAKDAARGTRAAVVVAGNSLLINTGDRVLQVDTGPDPDGGRGPTGPPVGPSGLGTAGLGPIRATLPISCSALAADLDVAATAGDDVLVIDLSGPAASVAARVKTPGSVTGVALKDGILAISDDVGGLRLFRVSRPESAQPESQPRE